MDDDATAVGPDQPELPFGDQIPTERPIATGWVAMARAHWPAVPPRTMATALAAFFLRWTLRLSLPLTGVAVALQFPYRATVEGVPFRVDATVLHRRGLSADTTFGNWEFPTFDGLPFGLHVSPQNVDILQLARQSNADPSAYAQRLQDGFAAQIPQVLAWLAAEVVIGFGLGLAAAAAINMAAGYLRGRRRRSDELLHRLRQLGAAAVVLVVVAAYGALSYNPNWSRESRLTGTLAAAQLFPDQLKSYYESQSKATDVLGSILGIQAALQNRIDQGRTPDTAFQIMFISDMHLAAVYPLVAQYARNYDVKLIVNTGDEAEFATAAELTPTYRAEIAALTRDIPMLWLAGNHDSPDVEAAMAAIPGVTVLGHKASSGDGFAISATQVQAFGLSVAGLPDPRVYGGPGAYGADDPKITDPLEEETVKAALDRVIEGSKTYDIFATHEPVAADELRTLLSKRIRQTNSGHLHKQNTGADLQGGDGIVLVEGSTGGGGLDNIVRGVNRPPIQFSIESVAQNCQFTKVLRFSITSPPPSSTTTPQTYGDDVTASTVYFRPQTVEADRICSTALGVSDPAPL